MIAARLQPEATSARTSRHAPLRARLMSAAFVWLLLVPTVTTAQQSGMHHLFDGVRRGSTTPAVITKDSDPLGVDDDPNALPQAPLPAGSLRQPDQFKSRVVLAAHSKSQPQADATKEESLPPPQIDG